MLGSPESLARGMLPRGLPRNRRELPISSHTERNASHIGRYVTPRVDRRGHGEMAEQSYNPVVPAKVGNRRALQGAATEPTGGKGETSNASVEGNITETQNSNLYVHRNRQTI